MRTFFLGFFLLATVGVSAQTAFTVEEVFAHYIGCMHNATIDVSKQYHAQGVDADPYKVFEESASLCATENATVSKLLAIGYGSTDYVSIMEAINLELFSNYIFDQVETLNKVR